MKKSFDAVDMMRRLREAVGRELEDKPYEEQRRLIDEQLRLRRAEKSKGAEEGRAV